MMKWSVLLSAFVCLELAAVSAPAGGLSSDNPARRSSDNPENKVARLISQTRVEIKEDVRIEAIRDLRNFDAVRYANIVPTLAMILRDDPSTAARIEAARSLGRIRPLTPMAREALARASLRDSAFRVRWQARGSLAVYTVARINPNNYPPNDAELPQGDNKPLPRPKSIGGPVPSTIPGEEPETTNAPYAKRLPKGPPQPVVPVRTNPNAESSSGAIDPAFVQPPLPNYHSPGSAPTDARPLLPPPPANRGALTPPADPHRLPFRPAPAQGPLLPPAPNF